MAKRWLAVHEVPLTACHRYFTLTPPLEKFLGLLSTSVLQTANPQSSSGQGPHCWVSQNGHQFVGAAGIVVNDDEHAMVDIPAT